MNILRDFRYAVRVLLKDWSLSSVTVLTLGLGIGVNAAIFSIVDSVLLRPLAVKDPDRVTMLYRQQNSGSLTNTFSVPDFEDLRSQANELFSDLFGYRLLLNGMSAGGKTELIVTNAVTGNYFSGLGIKPALGRIILPSEGKIAGADPVIVLSYSFWKTRFAGDPAVLDRTIVLDGYPMRIVGVTPQRFNGTYPVNLVQAYMPIGMAATLTRSRDFMTNRKQRDLVLFGTIRPQVKAQRALAILSSVATNLSREFPDIDKNLAILPFPERRTRLGDPRKGSAVVVSGLFLILAGLVLLLACGNIANLLLVRSMARSREMAVRSALGAHRGHLMRQLLIESFVLALAGGGVGVLIGRLATLVLGQVDFQLSLPMHLDFSLDSRVFAYAFGVTALCGLLTGVIPAIRGSRLDLAHALRETDRSVARGRHLFRDILVVSQICGSLMVLIMAGLFTRSLNEAREADLGFDANHVLNFTMDPNGIGYNQEQVTRFYADLLDRVRNVPGVVSAATARSVPMGYVNSTVGVTTDGTGADVGLAAAGFNLVSPSYFATMRIPLLAGREFNGRDGTATPRVAIVNEAFARRYWADQDALGRQFRISEDPSTPIQVVGVARNARYASPTGTIESYLYIPFGQRPGGGFPMEVLQVRSLAPPSVTSQQIQALVSSLAPGLPIYSVRSMEQALYTMNGLLVFQLGADLAAALGLLGLTLAVTGVYGVVSYDVSKRTREIGIRLALGGKPGEIMATILHRASIIGLIGLSLGLAAGFIGARAARSVIAVSPADPSVYLIVPLVLACAVLVACYLPARRATQVSPAVTLRNE